MNIKRLEINNCLGIKELQVTPGKINIISGGNERGKTSILECIEKAVNNTERRAEFVRSGSKEGTLYIELDNGLEIDRKIKLDGKSNVKVIQDGCSLKGPETILKSLVGGFSFNPIDFMQKKDKEQTEILLGLIPMRVTEEMLQGWFNEVPPVNLNQHAIHVLEYLAEKYYYDKRAIANGEVKECASEIAAIKAQLPDNYNPDEWGNVTIKDLWDKVTEANQTNNWREQAQQIVDGSEASKLNINNKYDLKIKDQNELLEFKIEKAKKSVEQQKGSIRMCIDSLNKDISQLKEQIEALQQEIAKKEHTIQLQEQELKSIDENVVSVKIESLTNENNIEIKSIEEKREAEISAINEKVEKAKNYLNENPQIDLTPLSEEAETAEKMKGYLPLAANLNNLQKLLSSKQKNASTLDSYVELARIKPAELLKNIELPVAGLGINEEMQIVIDGLPIKNLSTSRQIKLALDIAKATAGELKLICVDRFESLDEEQRKIFIEEASKDDYQYFITNVTGGDLKIESVGV